MNISISDFIIHVDESLTREQLDRLESSIRENACVVSAGANDKTPHLMLVAYNPECANSKVILENVTNQGLRATALGL
ncbi:hypothetical protein CAP31_08515 [Sulfuriferula sp. AH1]|uniref:hypothetical protein n=1 Tax=Sulfuriferula sp. AH1 TaxID=1985873 RepID=UPI000B3B562A|nr:hypothetical protein [Sulfuriferula sp. AH1]ARU31720.1 hypothetical protein CAP31_08515 [Sulfuriferula sp. AH1]